MREKGVTSCPEPSHKGVDETSFTEKFLYQKYSKYLLSNGGRLAAILLFLGYTGANVYGLMNVEILFKVEWMIPPGAYVKNFIDLQDEHFSQLGSPAVIVTTDPEYEKESVQLEMQQAI